MKKVRVNYATKSRAVKQAEKKDGRVSNVRLGPDVSWLSSLGE